MEPKLYHASFQPPEVILKEGLKTSFSRFFPEDPKIFLGTREEVEEYGPWIYCIDPEGLELNEEGGYVFTRQDIPPSAIKLERK